VRRPINWFVFALSLGAFALGRALHPPQPAPVVVERVTFEPRVAVAVPAALRHDADLEFGYVERDR
jgi:hypothetical protein